VSAIRAIDTDSDAWHEALVKQILTSSRVRGSGPVGKLRAHAIAAGVLELIAQRAEDLEPVLASIRTNTATAEIAAQQSAGRRARLEHALGIADVVPGALVGASTLAEYLESTDGAL
jgi:hypothetical protein